MSAMAYYVYILACKKHGTLYLGATNDIVRRGYEHRTKAAGGFTARYGVDSLSGSKSTTTHAKKNSRSGGATGRSV
jgi:predicted GIY-YIG superfamily endonuclease